MNFQGRLKFLHGQNEKTPEGKPIPPQLALFALACPVQTPSILEIRAKNYFFKTKHKLDFTPTACDAKWVTQFNTYDCSILVDEFYSFFAWTYIYILIM